MIGGWHDTMIGVRVTMVDVVVAMQGARTVRVQTRSGLYYRVLMLLVDG